MVHKNNAEVEKIIGYNFNDPELLEKALTHRSFKKQHNERLEFLGDSIVNFIVAEALYIKFPQAREGQLSRLRASLVKGETLALISQDFNLGLYLRLGQGELKSGGYRRASILADVLEAIIGAIYLDSDMVTAQSVVSIWFQSRLDQTTLEDTKKDSKSRLQEYLQARGHDLPIYQVDKIDGAGHDQTFYITCLLKSLDVNAQGVGKSRRQAEQNAAQLTLDKIEGAS